MGIYRSSLLGGYVGGSNKWVVPKFRGDGKWRLRELLHRRKIINGILMIAASKISMIGRVAMCMVHSTMQRNSTTMKATSHAGSKGLTTCKTGSRVSNREPENPPQERQRFWGAVKDDEATEQKTQSFIQYLHHHRAIVIITAVTAALK